VLPHAARVEDEHSSTANSRAAWRPVDFIPDPSYDDLTSTIPAKRPCASETNG